MNSDVLKSSFSIRTGTRVELAMTRVAVGLVAVSFLLTFSGNRWGSYIISPIPGIFLADLLLVLGAFVGVLLLVFQFLGTKQFPLTRWVTVTYAFLILYVIVVLAPEFLFIPLDDRYFALRDAAPFLYLCFVPVLAIVIRHVQPRTVVIFIRIASALALTVPLLVRIGALPTIQSPLLGSSFTEFFGYRTDLTGAALAAGIVAWGSWPNERLRGFMVLQLVYVLLAGIVIQARSGLVAVIAGIAVAIWLQRDLIRRFVFGTLALAMFVLGIFSTGLFTSTLAEVVWTSTTAESAEPSMTERQDPIAADHLLRSSTVYARFDTWSDVVNGLAQGGTWPLGGSAGSDYLYELCTGIPIAPDTVWGETNDPKCAVDDWGPEPVVRDPHNWILNIAVTHGVLGVFVFILVLGTTLWRGRAAAIYPLAGWCIGFYLITGLTFLISAGYALVPIAVAAAWLVSRTGLRQSKVFN